MSLQTLQRRTKSLGLRGAGEVVADEMDLQNDSELTRNQHHFTGF